MTLLSKHTIEFLSSEWLIANGITFFFIIILMVFLKNSSSKFINKFNKYFAFLIGEYFIFQIISVINGTWTAVESCLFIYVH